MTYAIKKEFIDTPFFLHFLLIDTFLSFPMNTLSTLFQNTGKAEKFKMNFHL